MDSFNLNDVQAGKDARFKDARWAQYTRDALARKAYGQHDRFYNRWTLQPLLAETIDVTKVRVPTYGN